MTKNGFYKNGGFSLIEILIVLAIAAIVASISIPILTSSMHSIQLLSDARNIATTMSYAKLSATSQMTNYQLSFSLGSNQWSLLKRTRGTSNYVLQQAVNQLSSGVANSGIAFKSTSDTAPSGFPGTSSTTITFNPRGLPDGVGIVYLSNDDTHYAVSVSLSGKVQIWKYGNNQWAPQ